MKKSFLKRLLCFMFVFLIIGSTLIITSCSDNKASDNSNTSNGESSSSETEELRDTRFDNVNFNGENFRIYTSVNTNDATNANALIEGTGTINGDPVNDAVFLRNQTVEDLIGIKFVFTESNYDYSAVTTNIRKLILSADDAYDLIINDLFPAAELTHEGMFMNINDIENFDYSKQYWYKGYMEDLKLTVDRMYIMAGDYFMDIIGSCHALFYNKILFENMFHDPDLVYENVIDGSWTFDKFLNYVTSGYSDLNGDGKVNEGDQIGFTCNGMWGSAVPFMIGADITFIKREEDYSISFAFKNERSVKLLEKLNEIFYSSGTLTSPKDPSTEGLIKLFGENETIFLGYQRLGYLEKMRDIKFDIGVVPYPKFDDNQENYITSSHDTTEIGTIPITVQNMNFITTVIEVCNRETGVLVIPEYYENALKVKYTRDETSAMMIDIIHDNFGATFPLAYGTSLGGFLLNISFANPLASHNTNFISAYDSGEKAALKQLENMVENLISKTEVD